MSWLPPEEIAPPQKKKVLSEEERWELFKQGIWTNKTLQQIHVKEMDTSHIIAVLAHIWANCNFKADQNLRTAIELGAAAYNGTPCWDEWEGDLADPKVLWHGHPFVEHAVEELANRKVSFENPWKEQLPF